MREASKLRRIKQENRGREITGAKEEALRLEQRMCQPEVYSDAIKIRTLMKSLRPLSTN
ncbi:MAG: hypothetical protein ACOX42_11495 [Clostridia bacterium]|jgi:hypothetical protein